MASHFIKYQQFLPVSLEQAWNYFSNPHNLKEITPPEMGIKVLNYSVGNIMYAGQIITYSLEPVFGIPVFWMTEIAHVQPMAYFIDEQRLGPYTLWHHTHFFRQVSGGVEMTDMVHYKLPFGLFGSLLNSLFVKKKLESIFEYRKKILVEKFGG